MIKPIGARVLLEKIKKEDKTDSGLYLVENNPQDTFKAKVVAIGDDEVMRVKVGDIIIYEKYAGMEINEGDKKYLLVKAEEIVALVE